MMMRLHMVGSASSNNVLLVRHQQRRNVIWFLLFFFVIWVVMNNDNNVNKTPIIIVTMAEASTTTTIRSTTSTTTTTPVTTSTTKVLVLGDSWAERIQERWIQESCHYYDDGSSDISLQQQQQQYDDDNNEKDEPSLAATRKKKNMILLANEGIRGTTAQDWLIAANGLVCGMLQKHAETITTTTTNSTRMIVWISLGLNDLLYTNCQLNVNVVVARIWDIVTQVHATIPHAHILLTGYAMKTMTTSIHDNDNDQGGNRNKKSRNNKCPGLEQWGSTCTSQVVWTELATKLGELVNEFDQLDNETTRYQQQQQNKKKKNPNMMMTTTKTNNN